MIRAARNAEYTKEYNRKMFLRLLRVEPMFRAEIARRMGLTRAATSLIAEELLQEGLICETVSTEKRMGRTPVPLMIAPEAGFAIGVYLNRDGCTAGVVNMCGQVLSKKRLRVGDGVEREKVAPLIDAIHHMVDETGILREKIVGVGVSAPGPLDGENGRILNPPRFDLWHHTEIGAMLQDSLNLPIYLENNASCLARYNFGKPEAKGSEDFLLLLVDSGIGSGGGKWEGEAADKFSGKTKLVQCAQFLLQLLGMVDGVDIGILGFKIAGDGFGKLPVALQGRQVCLQVHSSFLRSEAAQKSMSKQPVLDRHFGGSPSGDTLGHPV